MAARAAPAVPGLRCVPVGAAAVGQLRQCRVRPLLVEVVEVQDGEAAAQGQGGLPGARRAGQQNDPDGGTSLLLRSREHGGGRRGARVGAHGHPLSRIAPCGVPLAREVDRPPQLNYATQSIDYPNAVARTALRPLRSTGRWHMPSHARPKPSRVPRTLLRAGLVISAAGAALAAGGAATASAAPAAADRGTDTGAAASGLTGALLHSAAAWPRPGQEPPAGPAGQHLRRPARQRCEHPDRRLQAGGHRAADRHPLERCRAQGPAADRAGDEGAAWVTGPR